MLEGSRAAAKRTSALTIDLSLHASGDGTSRRYDFHWCLDQVPQALGLYRQYQQDARQNTFSGLVGGTDGSACVRTDTSDTMGASFALVEDEKISPGPSKYGTILLSNVSIRDSWRDRVRSEQLHHIPYRDTAPNKSILKHCR